MLDRVTLPINAMVLTAPPEPSDDSCGLTAHMNDYVAQIRLSIENWVRTGGDGVFFVPGFGALSADVRTAVRLECIDADRSVD